MKPQKLYSRGNSFSSRPRTSQIKRSLDKNSNSKDKLPYINPNFNPLLYSYKNSKKFQVERPFWEKEKLNDQCLKLEDDIKKLTKKYKKVEMENKKQKKEILEQNKELNKYKNKNFDNENNKEEEEKNNLNYYKNDNTNTNIEIAKTLMLFNKDEEDYNSYKNDKNKFEKNESISYTFTKTDENEIDEEDKYLTKSEIHEKKKIKFEKKMKLLGETTISNLRLLSRELNNENAIKKNEIKIINKNSKISKVNDILRERDMLENEIKVLKNKLQFASDKISFYENMEKNYEDLKNQIKSKDNQIKLLVVKNEQTVDDNEKEIIEMENVIAHKDKEIAELEKKILKNKLKKQKDHFLQKYSKKPKIKKTEKKENKENDNNQNDNQNENENEKNEIDLKLKYPELYQIYIEMKKKGLNSSNAFVYGVLAPLNDITPLPKNKIIYSGGISQLLQIDQKNDKIFCINLANKLLIPNKKLNEMKNEQTEIMNFFFNKKNVYLDINEFTFRVNQIEKDFVLKVFEKYDKDYNNFISFDNMLKAIKDLNLNDIEEDVLLFCKDKNVFNRMNYWDLVNLIDEEKQKEMKRKEEEEKRKKEEEEKQKENEEKQREEEEKKKKEEEEKKKEEEEKKKKEEEERKREEEEKRKKEEEERQREEEERKREEDEKRKKEEEEKKEKEEVYLDSEEIDDKNSSKNDENNLEPKLKILVTYLKDNDSIKNLFEECEEENSEEDQNKLINLNKLNKYLEKNCKIKFNDIEKGEIYNKFKNPYLKEEDIKFIDSKNFEDYLNDQISKEKLNDPNYDPLSQVKNDVGIEGLDD